jgi:hypothetical protein
MPCTRASLHCASDRRRSLFEEPRLAPVASSYYVGIIRIRTERTEEHSLIRSHSPGLGPCVTHFAGSLIGCGVCFDISGCVVAVAPPCKIQDVSDACVRSALWRRRARGRGWCLVACGHEMKVKKKATPYITI